MTNILALDKVKGLVAEECMKFSVLEMLKNIFWNQKLLLTIERYRTLMASISSVPVLTLYMYSCQENN